MHWKARKIGTKVCVVIIHIFNYLTMKIYAWPFHDCTLNVWYLEKRKVSDTGIAEKRLRKQGAANFWRKYTWDRNETLSQIASESHTVTSKSISVQNILPTVSYISFRSIKPACVLMLSVWHKILRLAWPQ